jgi:hypothetical protein
VDDARCWKRKPLQDSLHLRPRQTLLRSARERSPPDSFGRVEDLGKRGEVPRDAVVAVVAL